MNYLCNFFLSNFTLWSVTKQPCLYECWKEKEVEGKSHHNFIWLNIYRIQYVLRELSKFFVLFGKDLYSIIVLYITSIISAVWENTTYPPVASSHLWILRHSTNIDLLLWGEVFEVCSLENKQMMTRTTLGDWLCWILTGVKPLSVQFCLCFLRHSSLSTSSAVAWFICEAFFTQAVVLFFFFFSPNTVPRR